MARVTSDARRLTRGFLGERPAIESPRLTCVKTNAAELIEIAAGFGATRVCLCGSVARRTDADGSDIDFYVWEFEGEAGRPEARRRRAARQLVRTFRNLLSPYKVDVLGLPCWLLDPEYENAMKHDSIELDHLVE